MDIVWNCTLHWLTFLTCLNNLHLQGKPLLTRIINCFKFKRRKNVHLENTPVFFLIFRKFFHIHSLFAFLLILRGFLKNIIKSLFWFFKFIWNLFIFPLPFLYFFKFLYFESMRFLKKKLCRGKVVRK